MTDQPALQVIDIAEFARLKNTLTGEIDATDLSRLHDFIVPGEQRLHYELRGELTARREAQITCIIRGAVSLQCQRCLEAFGHPLAIHSTLVFVADESLLPAIEDEDESIDYVVADASTLGVVEFIEDEIILDLPLVPRHEPQCQGLAKQLARDDAQSPFAALARLKRN
ncbi:MAG: DUF177 domain-containing protein [Burkholderiales bacterium]|nr:DUF177 domain-containing protein [Burkholderiales bacterium]